MATISAVITLLGAIAGIWLFYAKRKRTPTLEERMDDLDADMEDNVANAYKLRMAGKNMEADAMLRRIDFRIRASFLRDDPPVSVDKPNSNR